MMARALWRHWVEKDGVDVWWARVEVRPGQWADIAQAEYEAAWLSPVFWDLPLQEDYVDAMMRDPVAEAEAKIINRYVVEPGITLLIIAGGIAALGYAIYARMLVSQ